jgi:hypothetical protein
MVRKEEAERESAMGKRREEEKEGKEGKKESASVSLAPSPEAL